MIINLFFNGNVLLTFVDLRSMVSKWNNVGFIDDVVLFDFAKAFDVVSHH